MQVCATSLGGPKEIWGIPVEDGGCHGSLHHRESSFLEAQTRARMEPLLVTSFSGVVSNSPRRARDVSGRLPWPTFELPLPT